MGRNGNADDYVWIDLLTAEVVDCGWSKRLRAQSFGPRLGSIHEAADSAVQLRDRWQLDEKGPQ